MGTVWTADQIEPIQRRVTVKLVKRGMASRQVLARFEAERQALALMEHQHMARVLDPGRTPRLACVPPEVLHRTKQMLAGLEAGPKRGEEQLVPLDNRRDGSPFQAG
jgi:hypothetical protein